MAKKHGDLTGKLARDLIDRVRPFRVVCDIRHESGVGDIRTINACLDKTIDRESKIAEIDIMIYDEEHSKVLCLIEIEESGARPKALLGDILAIRLSDYVGWNQNGPKTFEIGSDVPIIVGAWKKLGENGPVQLGKIQKRLSDRLDSRIHLLWPKDDDLSSERLLEAIMVILGPYVKIE